MNAKIELELLGLLCGGRIMAYIWHVSPGIKSVQIDYVNEKLFRMPVLLHNSGIVTNINNSYWLALEKFKQLLELGAV